jgi:hypothetical protein
MAKKGYMIESKISAKDIDALNRSAKASVDVDGGTLVELGAYADGVFTATKASGAKTGLWMAYNPSEHLVEVNGKLIAGESISPDPRDYTNIKDRVFDVFKPQVGDIVSLTDGNLADSQTVSVGKFLEQGASGYEVKASATASTTSLKVIAVENLPFPQAGIGMEFAKKYICEVAQN